MTNRQANLNTKTYGTVYSNRKLPLLEYTKKMLNSLSLENVLIISVQHLCSTTAALFKTLFNCFLDPKNLFMLGKCYSTNPIVANLLEQKNVNISSASSFFNSNLSFDFVFDQSVDEMLDQILSKNDLYSYKRIIILDDGGHLIEKINARFPHDLPMVGIEQTSSGVNRTQGIDFFFPIINLAKSWLKIEYESPIIISSAVNRIKEKIASIEQPIKNVLIMGYGVLGQKIYNELKVEYEVSIFDIAHEKCTIPSHELKEKLHIFDLIIGCSGATSLPFEYFPYLKKTAILASISSSDREFDAFKIREQLEPAMNCHDDLVLNGITLLNCGFPINFTEDYDSIDIDDFQLTRSLILASIFQAMQTDLALKGFLPLDDHLQNIILKKFKEIKKIE